MSDRFDIADTGPEDMALLHFTSGTTGKPKGAVHVHGAVAHHYLTGKYALDLHPDDVFWCTADPGWVTGTSYGIIAPLLHGVTMIVDEAEFDAERWYRILQDQKVTVWYTAPTAIRMLMKLGGDIAAKYDLSALRFLASVGEPLNPEAVVWSDRGVRPAVPRQLVADRDRRHHDRQLRRHAGQAGLDGPAAARHRGDHRAPPRRWRPRSGRRADEQGELALKSGWPSMFRGYLHEEARYRKCFADGWYLTGDLAMRDADGYFWFVGRADDVIKSAGHLIGPFEVESALMEHPAVAEVGVIGIPDPVMGEAVKAFVALKPGHEPSEALQQGAARPCQETARTGGGAEGDRLPQEPAQDPQRQDHAAPAEGARTGAGRRRHLDPGKRREMTDAAHKPRLTREHMLDLLYQMLRIRRFEEKCAELYTQQKIRGFLHLYIGEEAVSVGVIRALKPEDSIVATYREHGQALARGVPMTTVMAEMYGKQEGCSGGRGGSMHVFDAETRFYGGNAIVGGGLAIGRRRRAWPTRWPAATAVTACFFGDGAVAEGEFHESLNLAALWHLPVLFLCENNQYAMGTALRYTESEQDIHEKAASYNIASELVDGMDVVAVEAAAMRAVDTIREQGKPYFIEAKTYRFRAHSMFDAQAYRDKAEIEEWKKHGPVVRFREWMQSTGVLHDDDLAAIETRVAKEIDEAVAFAEAGTWEPVETLTRDVYTEGARA